MMQVYLEVDIVWFTSVMIIGYPLYPIAPTNCTKIHLPSKSLILSGAKSGVGRIAGDGNAHFCVPFAHEILQIFVVP
jgi:hypothetical protein